MIRAALEYLHELIRTADQPELVDGDLWVVQGELQRAPLEREIPRDQALALTTLDQFIAYVNANPDYPPMETLLVTVTDHRTVHCSHPLTSADVGRKGRRALAMAQHPGEQRGDVIRQTLADTIAWLKSGTQHTADRDELLKLLGAIAVDDKRTIRDTDGVQKITVELSVGNREGVEPKPTYDLAPFTTFHELVQPVRPFSFRIDRTTLDVTLRCADGGAWKTTVVQDMRSYLEDNIDTDKATII